MKFSPVRRAVVVLSCVLTVAVATPAAEQAVSPARLYVAVGYGGRRMSSADGVHWQNHTEWAANGGDDDNCLFNIAFGKGKFVATGGGASIGHILITTDGKAWRELPRRRGRVATVAFGNERFVAGHGGRFIVSADGEVWRDGVKLPFEGGIHFRKSAFGNNTFVAIGDCDPPGKPRASFRASTPDGERLGGFAAGTPAARAIAFGAGRFVVVGPDGLRESSVDGKTWEHRADAPGEGLDSVVWTGAEFLAAGGGFAYASPDGITWTKRTKSVPGNVLCVAGGRYVAASWGGNVFSSPDGAEWKKADVTSGNSIEAVAFGAVGGEKSE